ncbi:MAG TPA: hypothetical protein VF807_13895, partial [Ktedonobacterales bacterium]
HTAAAQRDEEQLGPAAHMQDSAASEQAAKLGGRRLTDGTVPGDLDVADAPTWQLMGELAGEVLDFGELWHSEGVA